MRARQLCQRVIEEPWRVLVLAWQSLCAALLPLRLDEIPHALERFLAHLGRCHDGARERRAAAFKRTLAGLI
jgi:hypothetical protein